MKYSQSTNNILNILNLNLEIEKNIIANVSFNDENLERAYQKGNTNESFIEGDRVIIFGWISTFLYTYFIYFRPIIFTICLIMMSLSCFFILLKKSYPNSSNKINFLQILMFSIYFNLKIFHLMIYVEADEQEKQKENIRIVIFDFITFNLLDFILLKESFFPRIFFLTINLMNIIFSKMYQPNNHLHMDGITSIIYTYIFYILRKAWEKNLRLIYLKSYLLETNLSYKRNFIGQLKGFHITKRENLIYVTGNDLNFFSNFHKSDEQKEKSDENSNSLFITDTNNMFESFLESMIEFNNDTYKNNTNPVSLKLPILEKMEYNKRNKFTPLGIYYNRVMQDKFYEVYFRKFDITKDMSVHDVFFYDVSDYVLVKMINEEYIVKQRSYGKIIHEFKTPINSIVGLIEDIKDDFHTNNNKIFDKLQTLTNLSKYSIFLMQDIIYYTSNLNFESISVIMTDIDLKEVVNFGHDILNCLLRCSGNKLITIKSIINYDERIDNLKITNDGTRLKQILLNLISNAVKFTKSGSITISAEPDISMQNILVSVKDTGVGISKESIGKLFCDNSMIQNDSVNNSFGSGLGLSICKYLANRMNLKIYHKSVNPHGSTFYIKIPCDIKNNYTNLLNAQLSTNAEFPDIIDDLILLNKTVDNSNKINVSSKISTSTIYTIANENFQNENYNKDKQDLIDAVIEKKCEDLNNVNETDAIFMQETSKYNLNILCFTARIKLDLTIKYNIADILNTKGKIIIIDDNNFISKSVKKIVESILRNTDKEYEIIIGSDGLDLLNFIREDQEKGNQIKCVILDEEMEYLKGSESIEIIRKWEIRGIIKPVKIFACTGYDDEAKMREILESGAQLAFSKPLHLADLITAFKKYKII